MIPAKSRPLNGPAGPGCLWHEVLQGFFAETTHLQGPPTKHYVCVVAGAASRLCRTRTAPRLRKAAKVTTGWVSALARFYAESMRWLNPDGAVVARCGAPGRRGDIGRGNMRPVFAAGRVLPCAWDPSPILWNLQGSPTKADCFSISPVASLLHSISLRSGVARRHCVCVDGHLELARVVVPRARPGRATFFPRLGGGEEGDICGIQSPSPARAFSVKAASIALTCIIIFRDACSRMRCSPASPRGPGGTPASRHGFDGRGRRGRGPGPAGDPRQPRG